MAFVFPDERLLAFCHRREAESSLEGILTDLMELRHALRMVRGVTQNLLQGEQGLDTILLNIRNGSEASLAIWRGE
jgi:hypothetical protein